MGKLFRKIKEVDMSSKSSEPIISVSVKGINIYTKVVCVQGVSKGIEFRAGMLNLYVSKNISLT